MNSHCLRYANSYRHSLTERSFVISLFPVMQSIYLGLLLVTRHFGQYGQKPFRPEILTFRPGNLTFRPTYLIFLEFFDTNLNKKLFGLWDEYNSTTLSTSLMLERCAEVYAKHNNYRVSKCADDDRDAQEEETDVRELVVVAVEVDAEAGDGDDEDVVELGEEDDSS